jgi:glutamate racemase
MIVMACNISSAVAVDEARRQFPHIPILGVIEPGAAAAVATGSTHIGVLATLGTVTSGAYTRVINGMAPHLCVSEVPCPLFVPIVEAGHVGTSAAYAASTEYLKPLAEAKSTAIILGCTHYPFLLPALRKAALELYSETKQPVFIDPAIETTNKIRVVLATEHMANTTGVHGERRYFVSGSPEQFESSGTLFLGETVQRVKQVTLP